MKIFSSVVIVTIMIALSGCTGASEENQTLYDGNQQNGQQQELPLGTVEYDLADYLYNALVFTPADNPSKVITEDMYYFDSSGNSISKLTYEKSYSPNTGVSIHEYKYDNLLGHDVHTERDIISDYEIMVVTDKDGGTIQNRIKRKVRINEDLTYPDSTMKCTLRAHYDILDTRDINVLNVPENLYFTYSDVLRVQCTGPNNYISDAYIKKGLGQVVSVTSNDGVITYSVLDQNSWKIVGQ